MDKDVAALKLLVSNKTPILSVKKRTGVQSVEIIEGKHQTKISFCLLPMWSVDMPPYNLARLTAVTRKAGYKTELLDFNVDSYLKMKVSNPEVADAYSPSVSWLWMEKRNYNEKILPYLISHLDEYIDRLLKTESDIVGFSLYWTNQFATDYVASKLKEQRPDVTIIYGGPTCADQPPNLYQPPEFVDYYFVGESEQNILDFLEAYEKKTLPVLRNGKKVENKKIGGLYSDIRIDLDDLPYPDYSGLPLEQYGHTVVAEFSRGCVARCSYCSEVWYWKFRDRNAKSMVDEIEYQYHNYGTRFIYFADSLINGNLKEFRNFCQELADRKLEHLSWWAYARADGRMDLEFFKLIRASGGIGFNFGFESGSDKVLKAINKKNTVAEINQNIIDCKKSGVQVSALMIFGAPGEDIAALSETMNLLWNHKNRINIVSLGFGLGDNPGTEYDDRAKFNINDRKVAWMGRWWTLDLKNTGIHRFVRGKLLNILVDIANKHSDKPIMNNNYPIKDLSRHYTANFRDTEIDLYVENDSTFNYEPIETDLSPFANSLMNECFSLLHTLWKAKGAYDIHIRFRDDMDQEDFDPVRPFNWFSYEADIKFQIYKDGVYNIECNHKFVDFGKTRSPTGKEKDYPVKMDESFEYTYKNSGKW